MVANTRWWLLGACGRNPLVRAVDRLELLVIARAIPSQPVDPQMVWDTRGVRRVDAAHSTSKATVDAIGIARCMANGGHRGRRFGC